MGKLRLHYRTVLPVGLIVLCASCRSPLFPDDDPGLVGPIVATGQGLWRGIKDGPLQIHVKSGLEDECGIIFSVDSSSEIIDSRGSRSVTASTEILVEGAIVAVWYDLALLSCPGGSYAEALERLE